ncbi:MAG: polysaccharide biosynthesis tyrosine autokinase [Bacteroidales bacterium]|nr:polysaccharide biosynthesis tyrosine autokinase [Bacteroidales bacterium]
MADIKIPFLNQKLVLPTFLTIIRKSLWVIICIILVSLFGGYLFHRYTRPEYKTNTVIQVKTENKANKMLNINSGIMETDIAPVVELIRSNEFIKRVVDSLNFNVSYYNKGTITYTEYYKTAPFYVDYILTNPLIKDQKINCEFIKPDKCLLSYQIINENHEYLIETNKWNNISGMDICISVDPGNSGIYDNNNQYFFIINDEKTILSSIISRLNVQSLSESAGTILITYTDYNPVKSAEITNTIAEQFLEFDSEKKKESATMILQYIDQQMDNILNNLNETEKELQKFRMENNILITDEIALSNKTHIKANQITDIESKILNIDFEIIVLDEIAEMIRNSEEINSYEILAMLSGKQTGVLLSSIVNSIQNLINQRELYLFDITENSNKIKIIDEQINTKKKTIIDFISSAKVRMEAEKSEYWSRLKDLESEIYDINSYDEMEYARLNRLYSINQNFYSQLMKTKAETMVSQAGYITNNIILEKASIPFSPSYPKLNAVLLIAFIISLIISFLYLIIKYVFYSKILTVDDIVEYTQIPVIGAVPDAKIDMPESQVIVHLRPKSALTESFRNIRTKLEFYPVEDPGLARVITVSSTVAAEGKTFVGLNIAAVFAMSNKKTIVLDLDLRKPRLHKSFNVDNIKGISTILIKRHTYKECLHHSEIENLDFITSGPIPPNPAEIILNDSYKELIEDLKREYDIIVIDTPPVGIVIDALVSYRMADNTIYVMRSEVSNRNFINNINNITVNNELRNVSIILNDINISASRYGYGVGYSYGYGSYGGYGYTKNERSTYYGEEFDKKVGLIGKIFKRNKK